MDTCGTPLEDAKSVSSPRESSSTSLLSPGGGSLTKNPGNSASYSNMSVGAAGSTTTSDVGKDVWPTGSKSYELINSIGSGATAQVYSAMCLPRNQKCAIKRINLEKVSTNMEELCKEIQAMSLCNHENVVTYYTSFVVGEELWLVIKLLSGGSLHDIIRYRLENEDCRQGIFDETTIATVLKEVLKGLEYFHNNGQIHRDIKAGNILLGEDGSVQIADFGVSAFIANYGGGLRDNCRHTFVGTPCFMAPEVMEQVVGYDYKADIWSFGITAIELATGRAPYHKFPAMKVLMLTLQNEPPSLETGAEIKDQYKHYSKSFRKLIGDCLLKDPSKRPTATELLKHPFLKKARDRRYLKETLLDHGPGMYVKPFEDEKPSGSGRFFRTASGEWTFTEDEDYVADQDLLSNPVQQQVDAPLLLSNGSLNADAPWTSGQMVGFVLRVRNQNRELNDIRFEYTVEVDSADAIANELVSAGLVDGSDRIVVAANLEKTIASPPASRSLVFPLNSGVLPNEVADESSLLGYAQLTVLGVFPLPPSGDELDPQTTLPHDGGQVTTN